MVTSFDTKTIDDMKNARTLNEMLAILKRIERSINSKESVIDNALLSLSGNVSLSAKKSGDITLDMQDDIKATPPRKQEFVKTIDDHKKVKLQGFKAPPVSQIKAHMKELNELYQNTMELKAAQAIIVQSFSKLPQREKALKEVEKLIEQASTAIQKGLVLVNKIAKGHVPSEMKSMAYAIKRHLEKSIDAKSFTGEIKPYVYVSLPEKTGHFLFQYYIPLDGLIDNHGYRYPEYLIVLSGEVNDQGMLSYYMTTLPEFQLPGTFPIGVKPVESQAEALRRASTLIARDEILVKTDRKKIGTDTKGAKRAGLAKIKNVEDIRIHDDTLFLFLKRKATPADINNVITEALPIVYNLVGIKRKSKAAVKYSVKTSRSGQKVVGFILTPTHQNDDYSMNLSALKELRDAMGFTESKYDPVFNEMKKALRKL